MQKIYIIVKMIFNKFMFKNMYTQQNKYFVCRKQTYIAQTELFTFDHQQFNIEATTGERKTHPFNSRLRSAPHCWDINCQEWSGNEYFSPDVILVHTLNWF